MAPSLSLVVGIILCVTPAGVAQGRPETPPDVDALGDPLPVGAVARLGTQRWRIYESPLLFSSDGRVAVAVGHKPWLIDGASGRTLRQFDLLANRAFLMPDDKTLIVAGTRKPAPQRVDALYYLDIATGKELRRLPMADGDCSWSADGRRMACSRFANKQHVVEVWDLDAGKVLRTWQEAPGEALLAPNGKTIAFRNNPGTVLQDVAGGKERCRWKSPMPSSGRTANARLLLFSPDGKVLASAEPRGVTLWDPATGRPPAGSRGASLLETTGQCAVTLAFSADSRYLAAGGSAGALYVWDVRAGKLLHAIAGAGNGLPIYVLDFTPDGKTLISQAHLSPSPRLWDVAGGRETTPAGGNATRVDALTFSPDGKTIATTGPGDPVTLWDARTGKPLRRFPTYANVGGLYGGALAFSPGGKALARGCFHYLSRWDLETGKVRYQTKGNGPYDTHTPGVDRSRLLFPQCSLDEDTLVAVFPGEEKEVRGGGRQPTIRVHWAMIGLFDLRTDRIVRSFRVDADQFLAQVFLSPDRRTLVGQNNETLYAWDLARGVERFRFKIPGPYGAAVSFSADGRTLFLACPELFVNDLKHVVHLYEVASAKKRARVEVKMGGANLQTRCAVANERLLAVTLQDRIQVFDLLSARELGRFQTGGPRIDCLAFSPDGKTLATGSADTTALVWDLSGLVSPVPPVRLARDDLARCWADLRGGDAERAFHAIRLLSRAPEPTVAFLQEHLRAVPPVPEENIRTLLRQLDSDRFDERDRATRALLHLGEAAEKALEEFLKNRPTLESQRRAEIILRKLQETHRKSPPPLPVEVLREVRAVEVLERIGTPEARALLARLAQGSPFAVLTREAQASLQRLTNHSPCSPNTK